MVRFFFFIRFILGNEERSSQQEGFVGAHFATNVPGFFAPPKINVDTGGLVLIWLSKLKTVLQRHEMH